MKNARFRRLASTAAALCLLGAGIGCAAALSTAQSESRPDARTGTLRTLDHALRRLEPASSDYRRVLRDVLTAMPRDADSRVGTEIRSFLTRIPSPGPDFRCSADFVRSRARKALWRLRETLLNANPGPVEPAVCYADPYAVDVTQARQPDSLVNIYGYDFDVVSPQVVLINSDGFEDVTAALVARSHHHLTLDIGSSQVPFSPTSQSLGLAWGHAIRHSISLMRPTTPLCSSHVETVPAGRTVSYLPPVSVEGFLARPGTKVWADAMLDYESNELAVTICATATHQTGDATLVGGCAKHFLYTTDPDRVIDGVVGNLSSRVSIVRGHRSADLEKGTRSGPVAQWIVGVSRSSDVESEPSVTARLNEVRVVSSESDGCISPTAYLEAKRTGVPSAATRTRLDPQLKAIDPAILVLRPRFAPSNP